MELYTPILGNYLELNKRLIELEERVIKLENGVKKATTYATYGQLGCKFSPASGELNKGTGGKAEL